jgi:hypothetical protein
MRQISVIVNMMAQHCAASPGTFPKLGNGRAIFLSVNLASSN